MKVAVIGAAGQIGQHIVHLLHKNDQHEVIAMVRKEEQQQALMDQGIASKRLDLEDTVDTIAEALAGVDAVIFTAGSGGKTGLDKTLLIDLDGAVKTIEATEKLGIERYIMVSAFQANHRASWNNQMRPYYVAKHYADRLLKRSQLNYTIIRPGGLTNDPGTGEIKIAKNLIDPGLVPREDVAATVVQALDKSSLCRKSFDLISGDISIDEALTML